MPAGIKGSKVLRSVFVDISPLRESRDYRLLFFGQVVSLVGRQLTIVASAIQIYGITGETYAVGLLGLAQFPTTLLGSFLGGTLADAFDRRRILIAAQLFMAATTVGLALNALSSSPSAWLVVVLMMANALGSAVDGPARAAAIPKIVPARKLPAAFALQGLLWQLAASVGPALGGVMIAGASLATAYWADTITFGAAVLTLALMAPLLPAGGGTRPGFRSIAEGLRFVATAKPLQGILAIDLTAMILSYPTALFPEWGAHILGGSEATVGFLYSAPAVGALLIGAASGPFSRLRSSGRATVTAVVIYGLSVAAFGLTSNLWLSLLALGMAGGADAMAAVFRHTILQITAPDRLRGRLSAVQIAIVGGGPRLGEARAGAVASATSLRVAAWAGGLAAAAGALVVARALPEFSRWRIPDVVDLQE